MPAARHIQPMGLSGRLEAMRVPTKGITRKGNRKTNTMLGPPVPQLEGGSTFRVRKYNTTVATNMPTERAPSDQASQAARLIPLSARLRSFAPSVTAPTLQHHRLPSVTTTVTTIVLSRGEPNSQDPRTRALSDVCLQLQNRSRIFRGGVRT